MPLLRLIGRRLAHYLSQPSKRDVHVATCRPEVVASTLRKGDVLLVEGASRFGVTIKYLTQSTWSHAALFIADALGPPAPGEEPRVLLEADIIEGVRAVSLSMHSNRHTRICRPVGLSREETDAIAAYAVSRIGDQYDLKNVIDLARYLIQTPPVPTQWRRRLFALGSGEPTRAICSSLIAQAFQSVRYPILPEVIVSQSEDPACVACYDEFLHIRHHSLFTPRDFDLSPYFRIVKPTIEHGFDHHRLDWISDGEESERDKV